jgi:cytochrome c-type biogenesis protein CcmH/NrfG
VATGLNTLAAHQVRKKNHLVWSITGHCDLHHIGLVHLQRYMKKVGPKWVAENLQRFDKVRLSEPDMTEQSQLVTARSGWTVRQVYVTAAICLFIGVAVGYLFRGSQMPSTAQSASATTQAPQQLQPQIPTLDQMKHMADKQAEPLLAKLQGDARNPDLLYQIGRVYESAHQFKEAAAYYEKSLSIKPQNVVVRNEMASCLYYIGDVDGALQQLDRSLKDDPKNPNSLFNLGMIRWQGKNDSQGAVSAWQRLLKLNPNLESQKKDQVQKLIAEVRDHPGLSQEAKKTDKE